MTAHDIVESLVMSKITGGHFVDYDPLYLVMEAVAQQIGENRMRENPKARKVWLKAVKELQQSGDLEHNSCIPCRTCDVAFEPVIGDRLFELFLACWPGNETENLLAIHKCAACGGTLEAVRSEKYEGDYFTPRPGSVSDDNKWAAALLYGPGIENDES